MAELTEITERKDIKLAKSEQVQANERLACRSLKNIVTTEAEFRANDPDGNHLADFWIGDISGLYRILRSDKKVIFLIEKETSEADAAPFDLEIMEKRSVDKPNPRAGYFFKVIAMDRKGKAFDDGSHRNSSHFAFCAYPAKYGETGEITLIISEEKALFWKDTEGKPVLRWPGDEELRKDWKRLD